MNVHPNSTGAIRQLKPDQLYHKMIEEIEDYAIILLDKEGIIQNWNKGAEKIKQYTESEAIGRSFQMFYMPQDRAAGIPHMLLKQAAIEGRAVHEGWRVRKDGTKFWGYIILTALHDTEGNIIGYTKITRDLTEKKIAEDRLKDTAEALRRVNKELVKSEERYQKMIAEVQDYAIILLDEGGKILNWNAGAEKIKGYKADEIIGLNFRLFYLPQDQANKLPEKLIETAIRENRALHEGWRVRKDGTMFWGSIVITALHDDNGDVIGFSKVTRDLTERKQTEEQLQEYLRTLEMQNEELAQFAYAASHDLQEPLRKIRTFSDIIQRNMDDSAAAIRYLEKLDKSAQRMSELIASILNYSRLSEESHEPVDLNDIIRQVKTDLELAIVETSADIQVDELPIVTGNTMQLVQLFSNLINNAIKFCRAKPAITIACTVVHQNDINSGTLTLMAESYYAISVIDNGIGFDQQYSEQIFSVFQRLHSKQDYTGTGIGLAICKRIMEYHNGFILAKGEEGIGSTFTVYFPINQE
jgi:PAS domain S-box-containing protein